MIKKCIYSFWSKPSLNENNEFSKYCGFQKKETFAYSAYLGVLLNKQNFEEVNLYTDQKGADLLINELQLPFDNVFIILDELENMNAKFWALGKLKAVSLQEDPFIHLDFDAFLFKPLPESFLTADHFFQCKEISYPWYQYGLDIVKNSEFKDFLGLDENVAYNCGIMGFNNLDIIPEWYSNALKFVDFFENVHFDMPNIIFEQHQIYQLLKNNLQLNVKLFGEEHHNVEDVSVELGYSHLLAHHKNVPMHFKSIKNTFKTHFPEKVSTIYNILK